MAQGLEGRHECDIERTGGEVASEAGRVIENDRTAVAVDERLGVEILDAADAERGERGVAGHATARSPAGAG